jgi:hypothetical protein
LVTILGQVSRGGGINQTTEFVILGRSDPEYASDPETRRTVRGGTVFPCDSANLAFSRMQEVCDTFDHRGGIRRLCGSIPNMLFACRVLESMGLKVKLPTAVEVDKRGAVDLVNSWTATGSTCHFAISISF